MSTPQSLSPAPLHSLGDHSYKKLFEDDFSVHKATLKAKASTANGGSLNYKGALALNKGYVPAQETKFQLPFRNYYFWFATRPEETKVHVDLGEFNLLKKQNFFVNAIFSNNNDRRPTVRFGAVYSGATCLSHTRLEWRNQDRWNLLVRTAVTKDKLNYVVAAESDLCSQTINKVDFLVGYKNTDYDLYLRHLTNQKANFPLFAGFGIGRFVFDAVYRKNQSTYGLEAEFKTQNSYGLAVGAATKKNGVDIKGKLDLIDRQLSLSFKGKLNNIFSYTVATQLPIDGSLPKTSGPIPFPLGLTLETSV